MPEKEQQPTLAQLDLYRKLCDELDRTPRISLHEVARILGCSVSRLSECVKHLEVYFGGCLVYREPRKRVTGLTPFGRRKYEEAEHLVARLKAREGVVELCVGTTNAILVNTLLGAVSDYLHRWQGKVRLRFRELDYPQILEALRTGYVDFGIGPELPPRQHPQVGFEPLQGDTGMALVCHPGHHYAREFEEGSRQAIRLAELATERLLVLSRGLQPGLFEKLPELDRNAGGDRIEVMNYSTILAYAAGGAGVGLVPGWYWILDDLRKQGRVFYVPMPELGSFRVAAYLPRGGRSLLSEPARAFLEAVEVHLPTLQLEAGWKEGAQRRELPRSVRSYRYEYHVTCNRPGYVAPEWRFGTIDFKAGGPEVSGTQRDFVGKRVIGEYKFTGRLGTTLLYLFAEEVKDREDSYVAVFNTVGKGETLVGTWTGIDQKGSPISAPMILSRQKLAPKDVIEITRSAMVRFIPGAAVGPSNFPDVS